MKMNSTKLVSSVVVLLSLVGAISLLGYARGHNQDRRNFWLLNNTDHTISRFYVSPHESDSWGSDILGNAELPNGLGTIITFESASRSSCVMDFKLVFRDGSSQLYRQGRNVCTLGAVQFNRDTSTPLFYSGS